MTGGSPGAWAAALLLAGAAHGVAARAAPGWPSPPADSVPVTTAVRSPERAAAIDSALGSLEGIAEHGAGLAVGVSVDGRTVWLAGLGFAHLRTGAPVDPTSTRFRVYSVSKGITTLAAAALVEQGELDLSAPVRRYLPGFPDKGAPITAAELLAHTAGIRHYRNASEASSRRHCASVGDALPIFSKTIRSSIPRAPPGATPPGATCC